MRSILLAIIAIAFAATSTLAAGPDQNGVQPIQHGPRFVDEDGDGFNDLAPDHDNDGIPNGQDPDWSKPMDGSGNKGQSGFGKGRAQRGQNGKGFIDADGDGVCDNYTPGRSGNGTGQGGAGFIDADKDGVCDNFGSKSGKGGQGRRGGKGR